jgi:hypothetical protein
VNPRLLVLLLLFGCLTATAAAAANTVDATLIPDGTYTVKVERVLDSKHVVVTMDNGAETTLTAGRDTVDFSKVKQNDQIKLSLIKGNVMVYADLTSH